jgi:hypothetical protein
MVLRHWNLSVGYILFSFGYERRLAVTSLLDGSVTVLSAILLTRAFGLIGAPIGMLLGLCLVSLPGNLWALAGANAMPISQFVKSLAPWFWRFAVIAIAAAAFAQRFTPDTFSKLAATALLVGGLYAVVMLPIAWRDPLGAYVRPRLVPLTARLFNLFPGSAGIVARLERVRTNEQ